MKTNDLKIHLEQLYKLEQLMYELNSIYSMIENEISSLQRTSSQEKSELIKHEESNLSDSVVVFTFLFALLGWIIGCFFDARLICAVIGIFIGIAIGNVSYEKDKKSTEEKNHEIDKKNKRIVWHNKIIENAANKISLLKQEQKRIDDYRIITQNSLNSFYNRNIIFQKYRNFIAISSIYEYFLSGRCSGLEGHEGAYNIFENEIRQNIIINNLNYIINNRVDISKNQYMLHSALKESENKVNMIYHKLCQLSETNLNILEDKTILSYHTEVEKRNNKISNNLESYQ